MTHRISRRDFLRTTTAAVVASIASACGIKQSPQPTVPSPTSTSKPLLTDTPAATPSPTSTPSAELSFKGTTLEGWETKLGDALYAGAGVSPVTRADITTLQHTTEYSELVANVNERAGIMAHNITMLRRRYNTKQEVPFSYLHTARYYVNVPTRDTGQSVEGHISMYDGQGVLGIRKAEYIVAWQWVLNPWAEFGWLRTPTNSDTPSTAKWINREKIPVDTNWHKVELSLSLTKGTIRFDALELQTTPIVLIHNDWGREVSSWIAVETISLWPGDNGQGGKKHLAYYKDWSLTLKPLSE